MSDLFHAKVPIGFGRDAFDVMRETPQHTCQILTKRSLRLSWMADKIEWPENDGEVSDQEMVLLVTTIAGCSPRSRSSLGSRLALRACCSQHLRSVRSSVRQLSRSSLRCQAGAFIAVLSAVPGWRVSFRGQDFERISGTPETSARKPVRRAPPQRRHANVPLPNRATTSPQRPLVGAFVAPVANWCIPSASSPRCAQPSSLKKW
ncbi:Phage protein Gp37/Gp68 [Rhodococcus erythropolis]|nr:Phage protein Gp37/Gp68 [Rhodococcus erythropolis]